MEEVVLVGVVVSTFTVLMLATVSLFFSIGMWRSLRGKPGGELAAVMATSQAAYVASQLMIVWIAFSIMSDANIEDNVFYATYALSQAIIIVNSLYAWNRVRRWNR